MIEKARHINQPTPDWEEQHFANFMEPDISDEYVARKEFKPVPDHVTSLPRWEPLSTIPPFQKHPSRNRV